jgi:hypothetical protein
VKHWEIIADDFSKGRRWDCVSTVDSHGRKIFVADADRDESPRFIVRVDEQLSAFVELESLIGGRRISLTSRRNFLQTKSR